MEPNPLQILPVPKRLRQNGDFIQWKGRPAIHFAPCFEREPGLREIVAAELGFPEGEEVSLAIYEDTAPPGGSPEGYRLRVGRDGIELRAAGRTGVLYGVATLRQLLHKDGTGGFHLPCCEVEDYPDIPLRAASRWLIELECSRMAYDWGDGRENLLRRLREKIDFCLRHKINMVFFEGFQWFTDADKYPGYTLDMQRLNAYARERNVRLVFGGHVIGYGGYPGHTLEGTRGLGGYNRRSYPEGEIYECGRASQAFDPESPVTTSNATRNGTCRSNEALNALKAEELAAYVRAMEPGVLYLHSEDISLYKEFQKLWRHRCEDCRRQWPDEAIASPEGAAAAVAHGFGILYRAIASVRNEATGYDAARDCTVIFASPTYGAWYDSDADWAEVSGFWTTISRLLGHSDRVLFCMREQFWNRDGSGPRLAQLAERLRTEGGGHGIFAFVVGGADLFNNDALFTAAPRLNHFCRGAAGIFNFNGGLFAPVQEIYNAEYCWNLDSPYGVDVATDEASAARIYRERSSTMEIPEPDALFEACLQRCYQGASGAMERFYRLRGEWGTYPLALPFWLCRKLFAKPYAAHDRATMQAKWSATNEVTNEGIDAVDGALQALAPGHPNHEELLYLRRSLSFGSRLSAIVADTFAHAPNESLLRLRIDELERDFIEPRVFTSPHEGEMNLWPGYLEKLRCFLPTANGEKNPVTGVRPVTATPPSMAAHDSAPQI